VERLTQISLVACSSYYLPNDTGDACMCIEEVDSGVALKAEHLGEREGKASADRAPTLESFEFTRYCNLIPIIYTNIPDRRRTCSQLYDGS